MGLLVVSGPSATVPMPDMLGMLVLDILAMLTMWLLLPLPTVTPLLSVLTPPLPTDMPGTTMESVRLRQSPRLMLTPSDRSLLDSQLLMLMPLDMPTMLEL